MLDDATFSGTVTVQLDVEVPTTTLVLNAAELDINSCLVNGASADFTIDEETDRLFVHTAAELPTGSATLAVEFTGILNDRLRGFYRSTYADADGAESRSSPRPKCSRPTVVGRSRVGTSPSSRRCSVSPSTSQTVFRPSSNGPESTAQSATGRIVIRFADTMIMSTYLVAFVVGRLEMSASVDVNGSPMRLVHVPGKGHLTDFGMDVGAFCLRWFEEYYGIPYPSDKVDLAGPP